MNEILASLSGRRIPSATGRTCYDVIEVAPGRSVTLTGPGRKAPSVLPWADIERVYRAARSGNSVTPTAIDEILENPQYRDSSTMCALVLAMLDSGRIEQSHLQAAEPSP